MPVNDKSITIQKLTAIIEDASRTPAARIATARRLLRFTDHSARSVRVAKRLAKYFINNEEVTPEIREKAGRLFNYVMNAALADLEEEEVTEDPSDVIQALVSEGAPKSHEQHVAELNKFATAEIPQKFLFVTRASDLVQLGLFTPEDAETVFNRTPAEEFPIGERKILNPLYQKRFEEWKRREFSAGLPNSSSSWAINFAAQNQDLHRTFDDFGSRRMTFDAFTGRMFDFDYGYKQALDFICFERDLFYSIGGSVMPR